MSKQIIITGATGLIGKHLIKRIPNSDYEVTVFTRSVEKAQKLFEDSVKYVQWDYKTRPTDAAIDAVNNSDAIIHLAGENVMAKRWNEVHKERVLKSRMLGTRSLINAIEKAANKPSVFISASAVGYYGTSETEEFTEDSNPGKDFLANVTGLWEQEVKKVNALGIREARIRTGIVLDKDEGALAKMLTPFKMFVGGPVGSGRQWFPWIHIDDVVDIYLHVLENEKVSGPLNAAAPQPVNMNDFAHALGSVLKRPAIFRVPGFVIKLLFGEGASAILNGQKVIPKRTIENGYKFKFTDIVNALEDILH